MSYLKFFLILSFYFILNNKYAITNILVTNANNYDTGNKKITTIKIENASISSFGDNYMFLEYIKVRQSNRDSFFYGEIQPRISLSNLISANFNTPFTKDLLIASELNIGTIGKPAYLLGLGTNINTNKFRFFKLNLYNRRDTRASGHTYQISSAWLKDFKLHDRFKFQFTGFLDYAGKQNYLKRNILLKPMLLLDVGNMLNIIDNKFSIGVRYFYWKNMLGINKLNESTPEIVLAWQI